jgi:thiamine pyrophosphokinase
MSNKVNSVLIITGGRIEEKFLSGLVSREQFSMVIAADHGLVAVDRLGITPDYIVGDFDSVPETVLKKYMESSTPIETFPREKDKTDTQIAIESALLHKATSIVLVGATGSRLDHTMANIHLLLLPLQLNIDACIMDEYNKIYLKQESFRIEKQKQHGDYVSLLPFSEEVNGLTLTGFHYPLDGITLTAGSSLGISNEIIEEIATVEFVKGTLLVIESSDDYIVL